MNQSSITNISQHSMKIQIIKQIRELDWSRETSRTDILSLLYNLEIACLARATNKETEKLLALKAFFHQAFFINVQTQNKFKELILMFSELLPSYRASEKLASLSDVNDIKTFDEELEGNDFQGFFQFDDTIYNPLAVAHKDKVEVENAMDALASIEKNMSLDWLENTVAPAAAPTAPPVQPYLDVVKPILIPRRAVAKKATQSADDNRVFAKAFAMLALSTIAVLTAVAIGVFAAPAVVAVATLLTIKVALAIPVVATLGIGVLTSMSAGLGMIFDKLLMKSSRKTKLSARAVDSEDNEESLFVDAKPKANLEPLNDNIHIDASNITAHSKPVLENAYAANDNIHQDPTVDDAAALETPLAVNLSASKHSLFHSKKENAVEPTQILVRNILRRR